MTSKTTPRTTTGAAMIVLAATLALSACSSPETPPEGEAAAAPTSSSAGLPAGNIAAGEQLANAKGAATGQSCVDCHGADGNAPIDATYPKLGGQYYDYLAHALEQYRDGQREHALMSSQATGLTDQQISDLAVYFGSRDAQLTTLEGVHN